MYKQLLIILSFLVMGKVFGQCCPYINEIKILPEIAKAGDSLILVTDIDMPSIPSYSLHIDIKHNKKDDIIEVEECFSFGFFQAIKNVRDTIFIGQRNAGLLKLKYHAIITNESNSCGSVFQENEVWTEKVIFPAVDITFQNPILDGEMKIFSGEEMRQIDIFDMKGSVVFTTEQDLSNTANLNLQHLAGGVYTIVISLDSGRIEWRKFLLN